MTPQNLCTHRPREPHRDNSLRNHERYRQSGTRGEEEEEKEEEKEEKEEEKEEKEEEKEEEEEGVVP